MGLTYSIVDRTVFGNKKVVTADVTFDSSYVTAGEPVAPASLGLASILFAHVGSKGANLLQYDATNKKLLAYVSSTGVEVANAVDLSTVVARIMFIGQ